MPRQAFHLPAEPGLRFALHHAAAGQPRAALLLLPALLLVLGLIVALSAATISVAMVSSPATMASPPLLELLPTQVP